jgi:hypothetical protein
MPKIVNMTGRVSPYQIGAEKWDLQLKKFVQIFRGNAYEFLYRDLGVMGAYIKKVDGAKGLNL